MTGLIGAYDEDKTYGPRENHPVGCFITTPKRPIFKSPRTNIDPPLPLLPLLPTYDNTMRMFNVRGVGVLNIRGCDFEFQNHQYVKLPPFPIMIPGDTSFRSRCGFGKLKRSQGGTMCFLDHRLGLG